MPTSVNKGSALPKKWIIPLRLVIYSVLAACSGYIYFNLGELELTHYLVIISVVVVAGMALMDCRLSEDYWKRQEQQERQGGGAGKSSG